MIHAPTWQSSSLLFFVLTGLLMLNYHLSTGLSSKSPQEKGGWTSQEYPDIRAKPWTDQCGTHVPLLGYVCDPSPTPMIGKSDAHLLNELLIDLSKKTKCKCQRKSQCMTKFPDNPAAQVKVGFVVAVAFVHKIAAYGPIEQAAEKFGKIVRKRWGLGDCGNSALIVIWQEHQLMHISTDEDLTQSYVTAEEAQRLAASVDSLMHKGEYLLALEQVLNGIKTELDGERRTPVDVGTLALVLSSGVASVVVAIITACVCAFRCCGNLRNAPLKEVIERVENMRVELDKDFSGRKDGNGVGLRQPTHIKDVAPDVRDNANFSLV